MDEKIIKKIVDAGTKKNFKKFMAPLLQDLQANRERLIEYMERLTKGINSSLVVLQENQKKLHRTIIAVNHKIVSMEMALGVESGEDLKNDDFEPGSIDIRIDVEYLSELSRRATSPNIQEEPVETLVVDEGLQNVIKSIQNSKPDKTAVIEWLVAEKNRNPSPSFADLATRLNDAGVPTLSGRVGWNRNSLNKMIPKKDKEDL